MTNSHDKAMQDAAASLKTHVFGPGYKWPNDGMVGVAYNTDTLYVYVYHSKKACVKMPQPKTWEGFKVVYHFNVGRPVTY